MFKSTRSILWAALIAIAWQLAPLAHAEHGEGLVDVGPAIPPHGFPAWYEDGNGLRLEPCVPPPAGNSAFPEMCIFDDLEGPPLEVGGETFYWLLDAQLPGWFDGGADACRDRGDGPEKACDANMTMALEATFVAEEPVNREQMVFVRLRIRIDTPIAGTYTVDYPFGQQVFEVGEDEILDGIGYVADIGGSNFLDPEQGYLGALGVGWQVGPFLVAENFDATLVANPHARVRPSDGFVEQYIANPGQATRVVGGTHENVFRITGPDGTVAETDLFSLMGKLFEDRNYGVHDFGPQREPVLRAVGPVNRAGLVGDSSELRPEGLRTGYEYDYPLGYPIWYADNASPYIDDWGTEGIRLTLCVPGAIDGPVDPFCISDPIDPNVPAQAEMRTGGEAFWWSADASFLMNADNDADLILGLEATHGGDEAIVDGNQIAFGRLRIRIDVFEDGDYRITHPYGVHYEPGVINDPRDSRREINFTRDLGLVDPMNSDQAMIGALFSDLGPQLLIPARIAGLRDGSLRPGDPEWPADLQRPHPFNPAVTEYFVGNLGVEEPVVGSPFDTNFFRVERKPIGADDDQYVIVGETSLFAISGKLFDCESFQFAAAEGNPCIGPPANRAPVARPDAVSTEFQTAVLIDVLSNDFDPDGDALTVTAFGQGSNGSVERQGDALLYTPNAGFSGIDAFTYTISDPDGLTASAVVTVTVGDAPPPPNRPPVAVQDSATTPYETAVLINVLANDSDPDGDPLSVISFTQPLNGSGTVSAQAGGLLYTPNAGFSGSDAFSYTISDGRGGVASAFVLVTVQPRIIVPVANNDTANATGSTPVVISVLQNDTYDGGAIPAGSTVTVLGGPSNGTAVVNANGTVTYTATVLNFSGVDNFTYVVTVNDMTSNVALVTVTVASAPPPPVGAVANPDSATTTAGSQVNISVLANDTFPGPSGQVAVFIVPGSAVGGTAVSNNNRTVTFTPTVGFTGTATFEYYFTAQGGVRSNNALVTVTVTGGGGGQPVAPVAVNDSASTSGDTPVVIQILANDTYQGGAIPNGATVQHGQPANGTVVLNANNTVTYTRNGTFTGVDTFTYTVTVNGQVSNTATVSVTVNAVGAGEILVISDATASALRPNGRRDYRVTGTTSQPAGNPITVHARNNLGVYVLLGTVTANGQGSWTLTANNSQLQLLLPLRVRATSSLGTVAFYNDN